MKKGRLKVIGYTLIVLSGVFLYLYYSGGMHAVSSKYKNKSVRDLVVYEAEDPINRRIDFKLLKANNKDIVGWVYVPGTSIDYPILIGSEDDTYLKRDLNGDYNPLGSIFSFANTKKDLSDGNILLFGHNMRQTQMFGELKKFTTSEDFVKKHKKFYIYEGTKVCEYDIVSIFICDEHDDLFTVGRELDTMEYADFITNLLQRNKYSDYTLGGSNINSTGSQVFSLVTCYGSSVNVPERLVVNGAVVRERYLITNEFTRD